MAEPGPVARAVGVGSDDDVERLADRDRRQLREADGRGFDLSGDGESREVSVDLDVATHECDRLRCSCDDRGCVDQRLTRFIKRFIKRHTDLATRDLAGLLDLSGEYAVSELAASDGDWVVGRQLHELGLRDEGVVVLGVTREDGRFLGAPTGVTAISAGDILIVYGHGDRLNELDDRPIGPAGDLAHTAGVARQNRVELEQTLPEEA